MVMAAGVGSRLDPLTQNVPKPLVPILNKPVMDILLDKLEACGIEAVIANTHYLAEMIQDRYTSRNLNKLRFHSIYESNLSGTAGGVKKCEFFFSEEENFLVLSADGLHDVDLKSVVDSHIKSGCIATMAIVEVQHSEVSKYGVVVPSADNIVLEFQEKPSLAEAKSNYINTGIYVFSKKIFDFIPANTVYDFAKDVFPSLMKAQKPINVCKIDWYWSDIGTLEQYIQSNWDALNNDVDANVINKVCTDNSKYVIGNNCSISDDINILNNVIIGNNCKIGKNVSLDNVILWDNVELKDNTVVKGSVIANDSIIDGCIQDEIIPAGYKQEILV